MSGITGLTTGDLKQAILRTGQYPYSLVEWVLREIELASYDRNYVVPVPINSRCVSNNESCVQSIVVHHFALEPPDKLAAYLTRETTELRLLLASGNALIVSAKSLYAPTI